MNDCFSVISPDGTRLRGNAFLLFAVVGALLFSSCNNDKEEAAAARADSIAALPATNDHIVGVARIEPEDGLMTLTAGASGRVLDVLIDENDTVKKGQRLIVLEKDQER